MIAIRILIILILQWQDICIKIRSTSETMNSKRLIEMCNKWDRIISEISDVENGENKSNILQCCSKDKWLGGGAKTIQPLDCQYLVSFQSGSVFLSSSSFYSREKYIKRKRVKDRKRQIRHLICILFYLFVHFYFSILFYWTMYLCDKGKLPSFIHL